MLGVRINRKFLYFSLCFVTFARFMTHILCLSNSFWVKLLRITKFTRQLYIVSYDNLNFEIALNDLLLRSDLTTMITTMTSEKVIKYRMFHHVPPPAEQYLEEKLREGSRQTHFIIRQRSGYPETMSILLSGAGSHQFDFPQLFPSFRLNLEAATSV